MTVPVTVTVLSVAPDEVSVTLPDMLPVTEAAKPTYIVTLFTVPPDCGMLTMLLYTPVALRDNWNPGGAVATMPLVKLFPETVNCPTCGLTEAEPSHAEMVPVTGPAIIVGVTDNGLTVIVKVAGGPSQPGVSDMKFPIAYGDMPTAILFITELVNASITVIDLLSNSATYTLVPSLLTFRPIGVVLTGIVATTKLLAVLITEMVLARLFDTYNNFPSGLSVVIEAPAPVVIEVITVLFEVFTTDTLFET